MGPNADVDDGVFSKSNLALEDPLIPPNLLFDIKSDLHTVRELTMLLSFIAN